MKKKRLRILLCAIGAAIALTAAAAMATGARALKATRW